MGQRRPRTAAHPLRIFAACFLRLVLPQRTTPQTTARGASAHRPTRSLSRAIQAPCRLTPRAPAPLALLPNHAVHASHFHQRPPAIRAHDNASRNCHRRLARAPGARRHSFRAAPSPRSPVPRRARSRVCARAGARAARRHARAGVSVVEISSEKRQLTVMRARVPRSLRRRSATGRAHT